MTCDPDKTYLIIEQYRVNDEYVFEASPMLLHIDTTKDYNIFIWNIKDGFKFYSDNCHDLNNIDVAHLPRLYTYTCRIIYVRVPNDILAKYSKVVNYDYLKLGYIKYTWVSSGRKCDHFHPYHSIVPMNIAHKYIIIDTFESFEYVSMYEILFLGDGCYKEIVIPDMDYDCDSQCFCWCLEHIQNIRKYVHNDNKKIVMYHPSDIDIVCVD